MFTRFIKEVNIPKMNETLIQIEKDLLSIVYLLGFYSHYSNK